MGELIHISRVRIEKDKGPTRRAYIENFPEPVRYGVHGGVKKFYGVEPPEDLPTTLDHMVAAVAGGMTGTLAVALAARKIPTHPDRLSSEVEGIIENVDGKPIVTTIKVHYKVKVPNGKREEALRAIEVHEKGCPASQSVKRGIAIEWDGQVEEY